METLEPTGKTLQTRKLGNEGAVTMRTLETLESQNIANKLCRNIKNMEGRWHWKLGYTNEK